MKAVMFREPRSSRAPRTAMRRPGRLALSASALLLAASCATRPPPPVAVDVLAPLDRNAIALVEARGSDVALLAKELGASAPPDGKKLRDAAGALGGLATRGRLFGLALSAAQGPKPESKEAVIPPFESVIAGDFDAAGLWWEFIFAPGWRHEKGEWNNRSLDLSVALPRSGLLVAARGDARYLAKRAEANGASPLPPRFAGLVNEGVVVWLPDPLHRLASSLGPDAAALSQLGGPPPDVLVLARLPDLAGAKGGDDGIVDLEVYALMGSEYSARILQPAIRLGWYFLARKSRLGFHGEPEFHREGDTIRITGIGLPFASVVALASRALDSETAQAR